MKTLLILGVAIAAIWWLKNANEKRKRDRQVYLDGLKGLGDELSQKSLKTLSAFEHYFDIGLPQECIEEMTGHGLVSPDQSYLIEGKPYKYTITPKGYDLGVALNLFSTPHNVYPVKP